MLAVPHLHFGQGQEIPADVGPFRLYTPLSQAALELIQQHQGQKRAEDMPLDGGIPLVKDGPGVQERLGGPEKLLHQQQAFVLHRHLRRGQLRVGAQDVLAVKAGLGLDRGLVDAHRALLHFQEPPITAVAHQAFGALAQLILKGLKHGLPVRRVLGGLLGVVADHITPALHPHLLDPEVVRHLLVAAGAAQHQVEGNGDRTANRRARGGWAGECSGGPAGRATEPGAWSRGRGPLAWGLGSGAESSQPRGR